MKFEDAVITAVKNNVKLKSEHFEISVASENNVIVKCIEDIHVNDIYFLEVGFCLGPYLKLDYLVLFKDENFWVDEPPKDNTYVCPSCGDIHEEYAKVCKLCTTRMVEKTVRKPYKCPVCNGSGKVCAGLYESTPGYRSMVFEKTECRACDGKGAIWK